MSSASNLPSLNQALFASISSVDNEAALVVPTRSLANILAEEFAAHQLNQGRTAWIKPTILTWNDLLQDLWQQNQPLHPELSALVPITEAQSLVVWTRILDKAKRAENELVLINVAQTAKAAQAAHKACMEWGLSEEILARYKNLDLDQFQAWQADYLSACSTGGLIETARMAPLLSTCDSLRCSYQNLVFYAFDLLTDTQQQTIAVLGESGIQLHFRATGFHSQITESWAQSRETAGAFASAPSYVTSFHNEVDELTTVLRRCREIVEDQPSLKIALVVPDLQNRRAQIARYAREVFYPNATPLHAETNAGAYRISLGKPLFEWPAIRTALAILSMLSAKLATRDLANILRSRHVFALSGQTRFVNAFLQWLAEQRIHTFKLDEARELLAQYRASVAEHNVKSLAGSDKDVSNALKLCEVLESLLDFREELLAKRVQSGANKMKSPTAWQQLFNQWLDKWGWSTGRIDTDLSSDQYQLDKKFANTLDSFARLEIVLNKCGLGRALDLLSTQCQEEVFSPQAEPAPILISGVYEAIGREVDVLFLTGVNEEFLSSMPSIPFIPASVFVDTQYPSATHDRHFKQMKAVYDSLLLSAKESHLSFSRTDLLDPDQAKAISPLIRKLKVIDVEPTPREQNLEQLIEYHDEHGLAYPQDKPIAHGMAIFKDQSSCPFKAFATHRLQCRQVDDPEFGLEATAQGILIHALLEIVWQDLADSAGLTKWLSQSETQKSKDLDGWIASSIEHCADDFNSEQVTLIRRESARYKLIITQWLEYEMQRPIAFSVVEKEWEFSAELGGIPYRGTVDRIDVAEDGRVLIIDYKTGSVKRSDWIGDRLSNPQMPLYCLAHEQQKNRKASAIAYAKVRRDDLGFSYLGEAGLFNSVKRYGEQYEQEWVEEQPLWQAKLETVAQEFLAGQATVDPVDEACKYCPYGGVCRIKQLSADHLSLDSSENTTELEPQSD